MEMMKIKQIKQTLNDLPSKLITKLMSYQINEKTIGEKQEYAEGKINENPLAYMEEHLLVEWSWVNVMVEENVKEVIVWIEYGISCDSVNPLGIEDAWFSW